MENKYINSSTVLQYKFEVLYMSISIVCNFVLLLHYITEANIELFTSLLLSDSFSYFSDYDFSYPSCSVKTIFLLLMLFKNPPGLAGKCVDAKLKTGVFFRAHENLTFRRVVILTGQ